MEGFADIEGPVRIGVLWILLMAGAIIALVLLAVLLLRAWLRRHREKANQVEMNRKSALEIALERLQTLRTGGTDLDADPFIVEVSDIVRDYLERALHVPAREQTSEEFLQALQLRDNLPEILRERMPQFLDQCDLVKFARQSLAGPQRDNLLETAGTVVVETDAIVRPADGQSGKEGAAR